MDDKEYIAHLELKLANAEQRLIDLETLIEQRVTRLEHTLEVKMDGMKKFLNSPEVRELRSRSQGPLPLSELRALYPHPITRLAFKNRIQEATQTRVKRTRDPETQKLHQTIELP